MELIKGVDEAYGLFPKEDVVDRCDEEAYGLIRSVLERSLLLLLLLLLLPIVGTT